jgi:hypothetical protein
LTRSGEYGLCTHLHLGRPLFQSDRTELLQSVDEYYASLQTDGQMQS